MLFIYPVRLLTCGQLISLVAKCSSSSSWLVSLTFPVSCCLLSLNVWFVFYVNKMWVYKFTSLLFLHRFLTCPNVLGLELYMVVCIWPLRTNVKYNTQSISLFPFSRQQLQRQTPAVCALRLLKTSPPVEADAIATPPLDGAPKHYSPKIQQLVNDIASLTLLEVSDLNELLKVCVHFLKHYCTRCQTETVVIRLCRHAEWLFFSCF